MNSNNFTIVLHTFMWLSFYEVWHPVTYAHVSSLMFITNYVVDIILSIFQMSQESWRLNVICHNKNTIAQMTDQWVYSEFVVISQFYSHYILERLSQ